MVGGEKVALACEPLTKALAASWATQSIGAVWPRYTSCDSSATFHRRTVPGGVEEAEERARRSVR